VSFLAVLFVPVSFIFYLCGLCASCVFWCVLYVYMGQVPEIKLMMMILMTYRSAFWIGSAYIIMTTAMRDLGIYLDANLSMRSHVQRTVAGCFAILRQLRRIRQSVPSSVFQTLVVALVLTRLDYGNATLAGLPAYLLNRLQSVLNASARLIAGLRLSIYLHRTKTKRTFLLT